MACLTAEHAAVAEIFINYFFELSQRTLRALR